MLLTAFLCTHARQLENNVTLHIRKREFNNGGVYYIGKANRCSSGVHIIHSREGQEVTWVGSDMLSYRALSGAERMWPVESVTLQGDSKSKGCKRHLKEGVLYQLSCSDPGGICGMVHLLAQQELPGFCLVHIGPCLSVMSQPRPG